MRVLAVDTTTPRGSLAVVSDEGVLAEVRLVTGDGHSRWLLPAVEAALRGLGLEASQMDAFAVTTGPGSFTGLRVGLSSVQGLSLASGRPCLGMSALDVLARAARSAGPVVALVDAFRGEFYSAVYETSHVAAEPPRVGSLEQAVAGMPATAAFVGDIGEDLRGRILTLRPGAVFPEVDLFLAVDLGRAALARGPAGFCTAAELRPLYLRGADVRVKTA